MRSHFTVSHKLDLLVDQARSCWILPVDRLLSAWLKIPISFWSFLGAAGHCWALTLGWLSLRCEVQMKVGFLCHLWFLKPDSEALVSLMVEYL